MLTSALIVLFKNLKIVFFTLEIVLDWSEDQSYASMWHGLNRLKALHLRGHASYSALCHTEARLHARITLHVSYAVKLGINYLYNNNNNNNI